MTVRAMWKGVVRFGDVRVPVKLYAAVEDRSIHFRLLHRKDGAPVRQALVNPATDEVVPYAETRRAFVTAEGDLVVLKDAELEAVEPAPSRDIRILQFLPAAAIDHRWYLRPYYLGPDRGGAQSHAALCRALERSGREGLARWVMRSKAYVGALRLVGEYPMLIALRFADQVVAAAELEAPGGPELAKRELEMAQQLIDMLAGEFEPTSYSDEYRERVEALIETKARGDRVRKIRVPKRRPTEDLAAALEASLERERKRA